MLVQQACYALIALQVLLSQLPPLDFCTISPKKAISDPECVDLNSAGGALAATVRHGFPSMALMDVIEYDFPLFGERFTCEAETEAIYAHVAAAVSREKWVFQRCSGGANLIVAPGAADTSAIEFLAGFNIAFDQPVVAAPIGLYIGLLNSITRPRNLAVVGIENGQDLSAFQLNMPVYVDTGKGTLLNRLNDASLFLPIWQLNLSIIRSELIPDRMTVYIWHALSPFLLESGDGSVTFLPCDMSTPFSSFFVNAEEFAGRFQETLERNTVISRVAAEHSLPFFRMLAHSGTSTSHSREADYLLLKAAMYGHGPSIRQFFTKRPRDVYKAYLRQQTLHEEQRTAWDSGVHCPEVLDMLMAIVLTCLRMDPYDEAERACFLPLIDDAFWNLYIFDLCNMMWRAPEQMQSWLNFLKRSSVSLPGWAEDCLQAQHNYALRARQGQP